MLSSQQQQQQPRRSAGHYLPWLVCVGVAMTGYRLFGPDPPSLLRDIADPKYTYVIVGGGTSGAVLAARLSEDENIDVLLLEAGGDPIDREDINMPIGSDRNRGSDVDWQLRTVPQKFSAGAHVNNVVLWHAGKGLGGTSNINYMGYLRGSRHDYDSWANHGAVGWAYKDVLPYFIKSEDNHNLDYIRTVFHGYGGRWTVTDVILSPITKIMTAAFKELGIIRRDVNGKSQYGYSQYQATIGGGLRMTTNRAFLRRALHRPNLHVVVDAVVQRLVFDKKQCVGVLYKKGDKRYVVKAKKEVLLAAGTVGSAKLLMLSGVGPRNHLAALKIPVVADLPVGENLKDHVTTRGFEFYSPYSVSITPAKAENFISSWAYAIYGGGMKSSPRFREGVAFIKLKQQPPHIKHPLVALEFVANTEVFHADQMNVGDETYNQLQGSPTGREGITIFPVLLHPRSRGVIRLRSSNPDDTPIINPNYLAEDSDARLLVEAIDFIRSRLRNTAAFQDTWRLAANEASALPACAEHGNFTLTYWNCFVRQVTLSTNSPVGTCRMGAIGDPTAVVDPILRVRGLKGLRVVDASIIPDAMSGPAYATQVMIAEKAADILREKDTVKAIKDYFKHLIAVKHEKFRDEEEVQAEPVAKKTAAKPAAHQAARRSV